MRPNWHKVLAGAFTALAGSAPALPLPWSVVVGALAAGAAAALVRPGRVSRRLDSVSRAIPGTTLTGDDERINQHAAEMEGLIARARLKTREQRER